MLEEIVDRRYQNLKQRHKKGLKKIEENFGFVSLITITKRTPHIFEAITAQSLVIYRQIVWKKLDYIFNRLKESLEINNLKKRAKERKKQKIRYRREELKIIENRDEYLKASLKANEDGVEKFVLNWRDIEKGDYIFPGHPQVAINIILTHKYKNICSMC